MSHANAALTPRARVKVARLVVEEGWPVSEVAARFQCSWPTVKRWADRYRAGQPMTDRSSRPRSCPHRTPKAVVKRIVSLRMRLREGPVQLAARTGVAASTVHRILRAAHLNRLSYTDRATGQVVRRYEHPYPGSLVHVDVKKIGNIPDGGGWRYVGARQGARNRASTPGKARSQASRRPVMGYACVHSVIDDYSRVVYSEIHDDEKADTAVAVLQRAVSWFSARGVKVERVLSDNGSAYRSQAWQAACQDLGIKAKHTRPYRPQTNGKIERFHRTLADGWAYARHYTSETQRRQALPAWLHLYNHHRPHTATQGHPPITRLTNLPDHYSYRFYDSVGKEPLLPFGFGLGYTTFDVETRQVSLDGARMSIDVDVTNTGGYPGKETIQVYASVPAGRLDQPLQALAGFSKTDEIARKVAEDLAELVKKL